VRSRRPASPPGRHQALLMSGCQDTEYSYDAWFEGRPNGAFTFVALRELAGLSASAKYKDWYAAIRTRLPSQQYPQSPNLYGMSSMKNWKVFA
jgi:metacaspase-1